MSGWTMMTVEPPKGLSSTAKEKAEDGIEEYLSQYDGDKIPSNEGYAARTVHMGDQRSAADSWYDGKADEVFEDCPHAGRVVFITAGDTGDTGTYWYFERQDGETVLVEKWRGYEGAKGRDCEGRLQEEHGMRGYSSWEA